MPDNQQTFTMKEKLAREGTPQNFEIIETELERLWAAIKKLNTTDEELGESGGAGGDVVGPAVAVDGDVAVFDGVTGKLLKDTGKLAADLVTGPASATSGNIPKFADATGKVLADGGVLAADLVSGPAASVDNEVVLFSGVTGKIIKRASSSGRPKLTSGVLSVSAIDLASEVSGDLPFANIVDISATKRILARKSAGSGVIEEATLAEIMEFTGAPARGDLFMRGAASFGLLTPGSAGQVLSSNGGGADLTWIDPGSVASNLGLYGTSHFFVIASGATAATYNAPLGVVSTNPSTVVGTNSLVVQSGEGIYQAYASGAVTNQNAAVLSANGPWIDWSFPFDITFIIRTGSSIAVSRWWAGVAAAGPGAGDTFGSPSRFIGVRYSTVAADTGWMGITNDGTNQTVTAQVAAIAASTRYKIRIRSTGSTAFFSINGGAEISTAATFPTGATRVGVVVDVHTAENVAKSILYQRVFGTVGL